MRVNLRTTLSPRRCPLAAIPKEASTKYLVSKQTELGQVPIPEPFIWGVKEERVSSTD